MADVDPDVPAGPASHFVGIGERLHDLLAPKLDARRKKVTEDTLHQLEADLAPLVGPLMQRIVDNPEASDELRALASEAVVPGHQFGSLVVGFAIGATVAPALGAALAPEIEGISKAAWAANPSRVISPDAAAVAVLKGVFDQGHGADLAHFSGYNADQFDHLVQVAGNAPGIAESLLLLRRGQIDEVEFEKIVRYSNIRIDFLPDLLALKYAPPTVGEAVTGALKHHLTEAQASKMVGEAGIDPVNFPWLLASAGRPLGLEQTLHLWNRGIVDEAFVDQAIAQSDINPTYATAAKELKHYFPPPRSIVPMIRSKAITEAQGRQLLTYYGVDQEWADAFVKEAQHTSSTSVKDISQALVVRMYVAQFLTRAEAFARLTGLNYPADDANALLDFGDETRRDQLAQATIRKVGTRYVAHKLSKTDADHALATADVPVAARTDLFSLWDIQRDANLAVPTIAGVVGALRRGLITPLETRTRLTALGVDIDDIPIFVADGWPPTAGATGIAAAHAVVAGLSALPAGGGPAAPPPKKLTQAQIVGLYEAGTIGHAEAHADLVGIGYTAADADRILSLATAPVGAGP